MIKLPRVGRGKLGIVSGQQCCVFCTKYFSLANASLQRMQDARYFIDLHGTERFRKAVIMKPIVVINSSNSSFLK